MLLHFLKNINCFVVVCTRQRRALAWAGMNSITQQYCKDITKGSFYNTPAMPLINTGNNTPLELNNKCLDEQNNTSDAQGDDC